MFHITGTTDGAIREANDKMPVLSISGSFGDAQRWFNDAKGGKPMHLQLYDRGYDIWMGNNRGTKYSNYNPNFPDDTVETFERWDFSWGELGLYDGPAFMNKIIEVSGKPKVNYIGYSMGTTQMFYGLTQIEDEYYKDHMNKFVALAPCIYFEPWTFMEYEFGYGAFRELGIPVFGGPQFKTTDKDLVCANLSPHWCDWVKNFDGEP